VFGAARRETDATNGSVRLNHETAFQGFPSPLDSAWGWAMGENQASGPEWYLSRGDKRYGPITKSDLFRLAEEGKLRPDDMLWKLGFETWRAASSIPGLLGPPSNETIPAAQETIGGTGSQAAEAKQSTPLRVLGRLRFSRSSCPLFHEPNQYTRKAARYLLHAKRWDYRGALFGGRVCTAQPQSSIDRLFSVIWCC
jgi:hypothetical protein